MAGLGLNVGLKALLSSRSALDTIGHNVANANTPGYSRQRLELSAAPSVILRGLAFGDGVNADVVRRTTDALLSRRLVLQGSSLARMTARLGGLTEAEVLFGEPGEGGLASRIDALFAGFSDLAASPTEPARKSGVAQAASDLAARFQELAGRVDGLRSDAIGRIEIEVEQANALGAEIASLNRRIAEVESGRVPANDLRDQRDLALAKLAEKVEITYHEGHDGAVQVYVSGRLLVSPGRAYALSVEADPGSAPVFTIDGDQDPVAIRGGSLGGLAGLVESFVPELGEKLDLLAKSLIFELNEVHGTGIPSSGPFHQLTSSYAFSDLDGDGQFTDERLIGGVLPFDLSAGELYVNVTDETTGAFTTTRVAIDPARMSVADLVAALDQVPHVSASLDGQGRLQLFADSGFGFDFSRKLQPAPDAQGTFGGGRASLGAASSEPYALADGDTLDLVGAFGAFTVTFDGADFADIASATADEVAAALQADAGFAASGLRAVVVGEQLFLQTSAAGSAQSFQVASGTALAAFGWTAATSVAGTDQPVTVALGGAYTGAANDVYRFVPTMDGTIGTTPGLAVQVLDSAGNTVATLDVGAGYQPGAELAIANGLTVRFGYGALSASENDALAVNVLAYSDTSGVVGALGLNALFTGTGAADIALREDIELDPGLIAASMTGAEGDAGVALDLLGVQQKELAALGGQTIGGFFGDLVGGIGFQVESASSARDVEQLLMDSLVERREQIAGVNVDEELVDMIAFEQAFATAAQYIQVVQSTQDELLNLI